MEDVKVTNVCRDRLSADSRDIKKYSMIDHFIVKNTAFLSVVNKVNEGKSDVYYINEKISETSDYHTTSLDVYPNNTLPYEAECVYPIMSLYEPPGEAWDMKGFLCVDSKTECAFRKDNIAMICFMKLVCNGLNRII